MDATIEVSVNKELNWREEMRADDRPTYWETFEVRQGIDICY